VHAAVTARSLIEAVLVPDHSAGAATVDASKGRANAVPASAKQWSPAYAFHQGLGDAVQTCPLEPFRSSELLQCHFPVYCYNYCIRATT